MECARKYQGVDHAPEPDPEAESRASDVHDNLRFYPAENDAILFYGKMTAARDNIILVVVNLDPFRQAEFVCPCAN